MTAIDERALEAAAKRSYEFEGDRKHIAYVGWDNEPEDVKAEWRESVRVAVGAFQRATGYPASEQHQQLSALRPGSTGETNRCRPISDEPLEALAHARTTASNDDLSKPGTVERERHCERIAAMEAASDEITKLRAMLAAAGGREG